MNTLAETLRAAAYHPERWDVRDLMIRAADRLEDDDVVMGQYLDEADVLHDRIASLMLQVQHRDDMLVDGGVR